MLLFFALKHILRHLYDSFTHEIADQSAFRVSGKRVIVFFLLAIGLIFNCFWQHLGFLLDEILFFKFKTCEFPPPVFIVGNARSGTTKYHRSLVRKGTLIVGMDLEMFFALITTSCVYCIY